jgi:hypothetical protein
MRILKTALPVIALIAGLGHANAAIVTWTYTGTIDSGTDNLNYFGGGDVSGDAFKIVITADSSLGSLSSTGPSNFTLEGGTLPEINTLTNPLSASVTIGGITHTNFASLLYTNNSEVVSDSGFTSMNQTVETDSCDCDTSTSIGVTVSNVWFSDVSFGPDSAPGVTPDFISGSIYGPDTEIDFSAAQLVVKASTTGTGGNGGMGTGGDGGNPGSGAPEPQTWAILLAGFAGMGLMVRFANRKGFALNRA